MVKVCHNLKPGQLQLILGIWDPSQRQISSVAKAGWLLRTTQPDRAGGPAGEPRSLPRQPWQPSPKEGRDLSSFLQEELSHITFPTAAE